MKRIHADTAKVIVWLGEEADNSDLAMQLVAQQMSTKPRQRGPSPYSLWSDREGAALRALCERPYWRRMWIIQELIHANSILVSCGGKYFGWGEFEALYLKLKALDDINWLVHQRHHAAVLQSSAATMVWQRAHYRHPDTPAPCLRTLIEIFQDWQCNDVRDKVFALLGLATAETCVVSDYDMSPEDVYWAVLNATDKHDSPFANILSQRLGLASRDTGLWDQSLIEYKSAPSERLVMQARLTCTWEERLNLHAVHLPTSTYDVSECSIWVEPDRY